MLAFVLFASMTARAQTSATDRVDARLEALERVVAPARPEFSYVGLGPVASKVYDGAGTGPRFGLSADFASLSDGTDTSPGDPARRHLNVWSVAPTIGYRPHRRLIFNAQIDLQTGGAEASDTVTLRKGAAVVRFAYLDWRAGENVAIGVRAGHQLIPLGLTNTGVDALTYFGVRRPPVERTLIPADWHENGALVYWAPRRVAVELGAFASLYSRNFRGDTFVAGGRSQGQRSPADDVMGVARVNYQDEWWLAGASVARGASAQGDPNVPNGNFTLGELHARFRWRRLELLAQWARGTLDDAGLLSTLNQTTLGSAAAGRSAQAAVQVLPGFDQALWVFVRFADVDLNAEVPPGLIKNPLVDQTFAQVGLHYLPLPTLVVKADLTRVNRGDGSAPTETWLGAGLIF